MAEDSQKRLIVAGWSENPVTSKKDFALARYSKDGQLDASFGGNGAGRVTTDFFGDDDQAFAVAIVQPGDKILLAGSASVPSTIPPQTSRSNDFALARYTSDGRPDPYFGVGGKVTTDFFYGSQDIAYGLAIQSDQKIVVAGESSLGSNSTSVALARYSVYGELDVSFGSAGKVNAGKGSAHAITLQSGDKIVVAGDNGADFMLARFLSNGSLDSSFGSKCDYQGACVPSRGIGTTDFNRGVDRAFTIFLHQRYPNLDRDSILVAGYATYPEGSRVAFASYNADGSLDSLVDQIGNQSAYKYTIPNLNGQTLALAITGNGYEDQIVMAGSIYNPGKTGRDIALAVMSDTAMCSLLFNLAPCSNFQSSYRGRKVGPNTSFNGNGQVVTNLFGGNDWGRAVIVQPDGKVLVAGNAEDDFAVVRYITNGQLDSGFGNGGRVTTDFNYNSDRANSLALQTDGKIVVAGMATIPIGESGSVTTDFALIRYNGDGSLDAAFGEGGRVLTDFQQREDQINSLALQSFRGGEKIVVAGRTAVKTSGKILAKKSSSEISRSRVTRPPASLI